MALAVCVALALSLSELLTKYRSDLLKNLVNVYLLVYLFLKGFFASIAYMLIPRFTKAVGSGTLEHALLAGFGYALVLRTKLLTVTFGRQELAVGPELLYAGLMNYVGFHLENRIQAKRDLMRQRLLKVFDENVILTALTIKIAEVSDAQARSELTEARDKILNTHEWSPIEKTYGFVGLLMRIQPDEKFLIPFLQSIKESKN